MFLQLKAYDTVGEDSSYKNTKSETLIYIYTYRNKAQGKCPFYMAYAFCMGDIIETNDYLV